MRFDLLIAAALAASTNVPAELQPLGTFHGTVPARDGDTWLALRVDGNDAALVGAKAQVRKIEEEGETEFEVASSVPDAMLLLRGSTLSEGAVPTVAIADSDAQSHDLAFGGRSYRMTTPCKDAGNEPGRLKCEVVIEADGKRSVLTQVDGFREPNKDEPTIGSGKVPRLLFAGDLDRDGALDVILDTSAKNNVSRPTLFLSSSAKDGELVGESATNETTGC